MSAGNQFSLPSQVQIDKVTIDGQDIIGIFYSLSIFEDIYRPAVTGNIVIIDSDGAKFIDEYRIEFIEPIEFTATGSNGESIEFKGVLNGLRNEKVQGSFKYYTIDFSAESVRKNEQTFIVKRFKDTQPRDIVSEMVEKLGGQLDSNANGQVMNYLGSRRRPVDVIKYVLTHGVYEGMNKPQATDKEDSKEEDAKGQTGFLCWETLDGFKFEPIQDILSGSVGEKHTGFKTLLANQSQSLDELTKSIVEVQFKQIGDFQTKLRSGAFGGRVISFDMDKGLYKEYKYYNEENMTEKQKQVFPRDSVSRYFSKPLDNQKFSNECEKAQPNTGDQSRKYLAQNAERQNTFSDQTGEVTLYCQFQFRAGDSIELKVAKVKDEKSDGGYDEKHSGNYVIQSVGHHIYNDGRGYTRIKTIRSTTQQDESSSMKP